jgi:DNA-binding CsgD family transcriptional regulator
LASLLAAAANEGRSEGVPIKRGGAGKFYLARIFPLHHAQDSAEPWQAPLALLLLSDPETAFALPCQTLRNCFGLTEKEAGLALEIAEARTPEEYASANAVTIATVRTQLRSIFAKTKTNGQADLIRLLGRIPKGPCNT